MSITSLSRLAVQQNQTTSPGIAQGDGIDPYARYIYIHGSHAENLIGQSASHSCARMTNRDAVELFVIECGRTIWC